MNKKLLVAFLLASLLVLIMPSAAFAAPASTNTVVTGRTEQIRQTGIITPAEIQTPIFHNVTKAITLTGTVVIDGPQLVFTVIGPDGNPVAADKITVVRIADKTYAYSVIIDPSRWKGNVDFKLNAKTIYINGKTAGQTHTSAPVLSQAVHVAYVEGFKYIGFTWGTYDRDNNRYPYSYDLVKVWDDGTEVAEKATGIVYGTDSVSIKGEDPTYDGGLANVGTELPPVNIKSFAWESDKWAFNPANNKYDLSFTIIKNLSNGQSEKELVSISGITPSTIYTYTAVDSRSCEYSQEFAFTAPAAPASPAPVVSDVKVSNIESEWTGNDANGGNVRETYTLAYKINGLPFFNELHFTFTKNNTGLVEQELTYETYYDGQAVGVGYKLNYVEPLSTEDNTSNNGKEK